jgi:hypothetical protein
MIICEKVSTNDSVFKQVHLLFEVCEEVHKKCMLSIKLMVICQLNSFLGMFRIAVFQEYVPEIENSNSYWI